MDPISKVRILVMPAAWPPDRFGSPCPPHEKPDKTGGAWAGVARASAKALRVLRPYQSAFYVPAGGLPRLPLARSGLVSSGVLGAGLVALGWKG
jgi:hypothetical protein